MGCRIGKWVFLETTYFSEFDLVEIGDHAALNLGATIQTHLFEDRVMKADHLRIGDGLHRRQPGGRAVRHARCKRGACLGQLSLLMKGEMLPADSSWAGIPSEPKDVPAGRERTLMKIHLRQSGDAVRQWAAQYIRAFATFAAVTRPEPTEPGFQERIDSSDFRRTGSSACAPCATHSKRPADRSAGLAARRTRSVRRRVSSRR